MHSSFQLHRNQWNLDDFDFAEDIIMQVSSVLLAFQLVWNPFNSTRLTQFNFNQSCVYSRNQRAYQLSANNNNNKNNNICVDVMTDEWWLLCTQRMAHTSFPCYLWYCFHSNYNEAVPLILTAYSSQLCCYLMKRNCVQPYISLHLWMALPNVCVPFLELLAKLFF